MQKVNEWELEWVMKIAGTQHCAKVEKLVRQKVGETTCHYVSFSIGPDLQLALHAKRNGLLKSVEVSVASKRHPHMHC